MINYQSIAENIIFYYNRTRAVGHTYTMINGVKNNEYTSIILAVNQAHAHQFKQNLNKADIMYITDSHFGEKLYGRKQPLAIDNHTLATLLAGLLEENRRLSVRNQKSENAIIKLTRGITKHKLENERLTSANQHLKEIIHMHKEYVDEIKEILDSA